VPVASGDRQYETLHLPITRMVCFSSIAMFYSRIGR
jgi:hypothetical protein